MGRPVPSGVGGWDLSSSIVIDILGKEMAVALPMPWLVSLESTQRPGIMFWLLIVVVSQNGMLDRGGW